MAAVVVMGVAAAVVVRELPHVHDSSLSRTQTLFIHTHTPARAHAHISTFDGHDAADRFVFYALSTYIVTWRLFTHRTNRKPRGIHDIAKVHTGSVCSHFLEIVYSLISYSFLLLQLYFCDSRVKTLALGT